MEFHRGVLLGQGSPKTDSYFLGRRGRPASRTLEVYFFKRSSRASRRYSALGTRVASDNLVSAATWLGG
jgi:hypothetical protein